MEPIAAPRSTPIATYKTSDGPEGEPDRDAGWTMVPTAGFSGKDATAASLRVMS